MHSLPQFNNYKKINKDVCIQGKQFKRMEASFINKDKQVLIFTLFKARAIKAMLG